MQPSNSNQSFSSGDPVWVLLAELSLRDFLPDQDRREGPTPGYLLQTLRDLGVSPECIENIARALAGFAKEALARYQPGMPEFSGRIRIFCQKKMTGGAKSTKPSRPYHTEPAEKHKQHSPDARANTIGGWGYFMIERGEDLPPDPSAVPHNYVDLYLYKEGE